jgi:hypothetical protein
MATCFKHDMETRAEAKRRRDQLKAAVIESCYRAVDLRDRSVCRVTGRYVVPGASDPSQRREHHHLVPRSRGGEHQTANVVTISAAVHQLIHAGKVHLSGDANLRDADDRFCGVKMERMTERGWETERML